MKSQSFSFQHFLDLHHGLHPGLRSAQLITAGPRRTAALILFALCSCVSAQESILPDAASASVKVADRNFWILTGVNAGATFADAFTTARFVGHGLPGHACQVESMNPGLYGRKPNDARVYAVMGAQAVSASLLSYYLKKKHVHVWKFQLWTAPLLFETQAHGLAAIHNLRTCH